MSLFTIVTVVYNDVKHIEKTIESVLSQKESLFEYIIVDGGSNDGTMDIVNRYKEKINLVISEKDKGIYDAMNKGISHAGGDWICFMNSGDTFSGPNVLESISKLEIMEEIVAIYGDSILVLPSLRLLKKTCQAPIGSVPDFIHQSMFVKTNYLKEHNFDLSYRICADYNLMYTICVKEKCPIKYIPLVISNYDMTGLSQNNLKYYKEISRITNQYSVFQYMKFLCQYLLHKYCPKLYFKILFRDEKRFIRQ